MKDNCVTVTQLIIMFAIIGAILDIYFNFFKLFDPSVFKQSLNTLSLLQTVFDTKVSLSDIRGLIIDA